MIQASINLSEYNKTNLLQNSSPLMRFNLNAVSVHKGFMISMFFCKFCPIITL